MTVEEQDEWSEVVATQPPAPPTGFFLKTESKWGIVLTMNMNVTFLERSFPGTHFERGRYRLAIAVDGRSTGKGGVLPYIVLLSFLFYCY